MINLWEIEAAMVFEQNLSSLLPFVPILKGGDSEVNLRQALFGLRNDQTLSDLEPLLSFFASFVFDIPLVQQMMRWDMKVLQESPWYNEIFTEGRREGRMAGFQDGLKLGFKEGETAFLLLLLKRRLGVLSLSHEQRVSRLSVDQLEDLGEALLDFTWLTDKTNRRHSSTCKF